MLKTYIVKYKWLIIVTILALMVFKACHHTKPAEQSQVITVTEKPITQNLYYSGTIQPLQTTPVLSPADGTIIATHFHYGDTVSKGQLLFTIDSEKFITDYKNALMEYVKTKNAFTTSQTKLTEGDFLHKNKLISDDEIKTRQSDFYTAQLTYMQAKDTLGAMLKRLNLSEVNIYDLSIADIQKLTDLLHDKNLTSQVIQITAPEAGMVLSPIKNDGAADNHANKGEAIKAGDVLALISNKTGFSIKINVNEFDVNLLQLGQKAEISSSAFPDQTLKGTVSSVEHQAQLTANGLPTFAATISIPTANSETIKNIYIGMSAKVQVNVDSPPKILIPLLAVKEKQGIPYVKVALGKHKFKEIPIKTGGTTQDSVVVLDNLQTGNQIVVPY